MQWGNTLFCTNKSLGDYLMCGKKQKPWLSRVDEFPWLREREDLIAEQRRRKERGEFDLDEFGYRKFSLHIPIDEVLKFARAARNQPEIWEAIQGIVERYKIDPETEVTSDENFFVAFFAECYCMKNDLAYAYSSFVVVTRLLLQIAHGKIPDDLNSEESRIFLLEDPFVIEENGMAGENG